MKINKAPATTASKATIHIVLTLCLLISTHINANTPEFFAALQSACQLQKNTAMCADFARQTPSSWAAWLNNQFIKTPMATPALVTGYYQPIIPGSLSKNARFQAPVYALPLPVNHSRAALRKPNQLKVLAYVEDEVEAFFIGIQGSALIETEQGLMGVAYAGHNGQAYHAIGKTLVERKVLKPEEVSMDSIKRWLRANPAAQAEVLDSNPRVIYFKRSEKTGAIGAQGLALTPMHSVAVDPVHHPYGSLLYLETDAKTHYLIAQDTGSAIKGEARIDLFTGSGDAASTLAGPMKQTGKLYRMVYQK